jgi:HlyD family secretion protein
MQIMTRKQVIMVAIGVLIVAVVIYGFLPTPRSVQTAEVTRAPLQVVVEEEGETHVLNRYEVTAPTAAFARRIALDVGDYVVAGQPVVELEAPRPGIIDARTRSEAVARVDAARANVLQATERLRSAEATARQAEEERTRMQRLIADGAATPQSLDRVTTEREQAEASLAAARAAVAGARAELAAAEAVVAGGPTGNVDQAVQSRLLAPVAGRVLAVHRQSSGAVGPGEPLIEIGDTERMEVRIDVLSQDAVRIRPGMRVLIDQWGGDEVLEAVVERVEPQAFTDVSSLGVEERRVPVVAGIVSPPVVWQDLGANYRVLARFIVWEGESVLQVPASAVFRTDEGRAVFVVAGGRAERRAVTIGRQAGLQVEVVTGLIEGESVIIHPDNALEDGDRVQGG